MLLLAALLFGAPRVVVLRDGETGAYAQAVDGLRAAGATVEIVAPDAVAGRLAAPLPPAADETWLALGPHSAAALAAASPRARAAAWLLEADAPASMPAVTLEVAPAQQVQWIAAAFPDRRRLIVLRQPAAARDAMLRAAAIGFTLDLVDVTHPAEAGPALEVALRSDAARSILWLLPDPVALTPETIGPLLQLALGARAAAVGFSQYFLRAGALGAFVVDPGAAALRAVELAHLPGVTREPPPVAVLALDAGLAGRLGVRISPAPGVELR